MILSELAPSTAVAAVIAIAAGVVVSGVAVAQYRRGLTTPTSGTPDRLLGDDRRWRRRRIVGFILGLLAGVAVAAFLTEFLGADRGDRSAVPWVIAGSVAGGTVGINFAARPTMRARTGLRSPAATQRVAHSRRMGMSDVIPAWLRILARCAVAIAVIFQGIEFLAYAASPRFAEGGPAWLLLPETVLLVVALAALLGFELRGRRIVSRATSASSIIGLDAETDLRRRALDDLARSAALIGAFSAMYAVPTVAMWLNWSGVSLQGLAVFRAVVEGLAIVAVVRLLLAPKGIAADVVPAAHRVEAAVVSS